ncbi:hypothetical protein [Flavobacterium sp. H122]|uniref:hypothetical protein n=1 Tax=Flavobacterium sp. H122 TaxID=2529860 RepID=UPI0010AA0F39|nr:hypothetical protein [Flavobacterium sp. H122]
MKTKFTFLLMLLVSFFFSSSYAQQAQQTKPVLVLSNAKTNKSIKVCEAIDPDKIEAILGKAVTLDKEIFEKGEEPIYKFLYDGLEMEMQNNKIKVLTITNKKWKLNGFTIGTLFETIEAKHQQIKKIYFSDYKFEIKNTNGFMFVDVDNLKNVKRIGVFFN